MEQSALSLPEMLDGEAFQGTVRLTTVRSLADAFLVDRLGAFRRDHPGIALEIVTEVRVVSLARREADVALRLGRPREGGLLGRKLAEVHYAFYAARRAKLGAVDRAPLIGYDADAAGVVEAAWMERRFAGRAFAFRSNSNEAQAAAARAGFGVAMLPRYIGDADARLAVVDLGSPHPPRELWLLCPRELARVPRVRTVLDAVGEAVKRGRGLLEGTARPGR
jgi:DNA-binding transcriptional LysR family regulator